MATTKASSAAAFAAYVKETGGLPDSVLLGHLCYFTVAEDQDAPVAHVNVQVSFEQLNLNDQFVPAANRPVDAFKKATKDAEGRGGSKGADHLVLPDGRRMNLLVRDVVSDREKITRHLVRELVDAQGARLDYDTVGEATFYHAAKDNVTSKRKPTGHRVRITILHDKLTDAEAPRLDAIKERILASYEHDCKFIDGMKLRAMVRDYVLYLNATQLKPGVYFVHKNRADELRRLTQLVSRLNNGSSMHLVELIDLPAQREEILHKFEAEAETKVASLVEDIAGVIRTQQKVTPDTVSRFVLRYKSLTAKATEYTRTLGLAQDRTAEYLELALLKLTELQEKVEA